MGKRNTSVCTHCGREDCDGIIYKIKQEMKDEYYRNWRGCKNDRWIGESNGKIYFHMVMGHGIEDYWEIEKMER